MFWSLMLQLKNILVITTGFVLLYTTQLLGQETVMQRYDDHLYDEEYAFFKDQGIKKFEYYTCRLANVDWPNGNLVSGAKKSDIKVSEKVQTANELLDLLDDYQRYMHYSYDKKVSEEAQSNNNKKLIKAQQKTENFFGENSHLHSVNILFKPVTVYKKKRRWYCQEEVHNGLLAEYYYMNPPEVRAFFYQYQNALKQMLTRESYTMLALLSEDITVDRDAVVKLKYHYKKDDIALLDILLRFDRYSVVKVYRKTLLEGYDGNPFYETIKDHNQARTEDRVAHIRALGFELLTYSNEMNDTTKEHTDDNLYLAIRCV